MRGLSEVRERIRGVLFRAREDQEMDDELRFHMEMETEKNLRAGMNPEEARRQAGIAFGGLDKHKEEVRDARGFGWLSGLSVDLKLGVRMLVKHPGLTLVGGIGMAVAIAISSGAFAFFHSHLYPRIPLDEGDRIVALENQNVEVNNEDRQVLHDFFTWREQMRSVQDIGAFRSVGQNLITPGGPPELVEVAEMTAAGFNLARVPPLLGRYLVAEDERRGSPPIVVIGYEVWQNRFAGDRGIVGREVRFGNTVHTVVGVMPKDFAFPINHSFWTPLRLHPADFERGEGPHIHVFGRLAPGVTMEEAQAELATIGRRTAAAFPDTHAKLRPHVWPYTHSIIDIQGISLWEVSQMQLMVSLLLLVAALNVAVLVYARTAMRRGEISVRSALGASRRRIIAQLFTEALVLAGVAAVVGLGLAQLGMRMGNAIMNEEMSAGLPFWTDVSLRSATIVYTVGLAVLAAAIVGVLPALQATGKQLQADLRQLGGGTGMRLGRVWTVLIVAQVAIAVAALPAAVNMGWKEIRHATTQRTYPAEEFLVAGLRLEPEVVAQASDQEKAALFGARLTELTRRLEAEPEVAGTSFRANLPDRGQIVEVEGVAAPPESPAGHSVGTAGVYPNEFELFGTPTLTGRQLGLGDLDEEATAVVVNRAFVRQVLGGGNALGRRVRHVGTLDEDDAPQAKPSRWYEIAGVVEDLQTNRMDPELVKPGLFYPVAPGQTQSATVVVRLRGATPAGFAPRLRQIAAAVDPTLRVSEVRSLADADRQMQLALRLVALALGLILLSVFLLSAAGIYALTSFTVTQRRREIGIRTALGAQPRVVLRSVFARAARQIAVGVVVGVAGAAVLDEVTGGGLLGGNGPVLLPSFAAIMVVVGLLAAFGPARRGLRIQPAEALRAE